MIARRKIFVVFLMAIALCITSARTGYPAKICKVISPNRFEKLHSFPVKIVVQFSQGAKPETFRASLNGMDITHKFKEIENGVRALVGPEDGLRIEIKTDPHQKINVLRTGVKGLKPEQHMDFETFFFVEVDKLTTVGPEGGEVKSPDGQVLIDIPKDALSSTTKVAITKVLGFGQIGSVYQLAPEGINFNRPVTITMRYHPVDLPPGVTEDDLLLILGDEFPEKSENLSVDRTANTLSGTIMRFSKILMSYYVKIRKKLADIPSRPPDTGQKKYYDNSQEITCPAPDDPFYGQDAHYSINSPSYKVQTINGHEVIIDHVTGLTWQRDDDGIKRTWREAMDYCENLIFAGYSDWRLPTKKESQSIVNYGYFGPAFDIAHFHYSHLPDDCYWSATTRAFLALNAWKVCFWNSQVNMSNKRNHNYVRAVRGKPLEFCHFRDNRDGTVTDTTTGLMWQQGETKAMTWQKALAYCENLDLAGYHDWRLPNIRELSSLVDDSHQEPSIDKAYFPGCRPSIYWSSTTHTFYPSFAWYVSFNDGQVHGGGHKGRRYYVRVVRGGK